MLRTALSGDRNGLKLRVSFGKWDQAALRRRTASPPSRAWPMPLQADHVFSPRSFVVAPFCATPFVPGSETVALKLWTHRSQQLRSQLGAPCINGAGDSLDDGSDAVEWLTESEPVLDG